jgi:hypothetical protein
MHTAIMVFTLLWSTPLMARAQMSSYVQHQAPLSGSPAKRISEKKL